MKRKPVRLSERLSYVVLLVIFLNFLWPLLWLILASISTRPAWKLVMPNPATLENYRSIISTPLNLRSFLNSFLMSFGEATVALLLGLLAAFPLSRYRLKGKSKLLFSMLFLSGLPITTVMVPLYMMFFQLRVIDNLAATTLFMAAASLPNAIWMLKSFVDGVPTSLEEAAAIDGASVVQILGRVVAPLMLPGILVVFIFNFSGTWSNFFVPFILINSLEKMPASVTIFQFFNSYGRVAYGQLAAYSILYTVPVIVLYLIAQKHMSQGFAFNGALK
jgi:multiple sugar transport system permease protein